MNSDIQKMQEQIHELTKELSEIKTRLNETDAVIASLQAWTQYGFGMLLMHLSDPKNLERDQVSSLLETVFANMYRKLKLGFRGDAELVNSRDGFDRLYACAQETIDIWQSMFDHNFANEPDSTGYKLVNTAIDMLNRIDPMDQRGRPFESPAEKQLRKAARDLVYKAQRRQP